MEIETLIKDIKKRRAVVASIILATFVVMAIATFIQPLKYSVKSRLLISQNLTGSDPYTVSKSNQYLSNLFSQVVYSSSFFNLVSDAGFNIESSYFGYDYKKQMKTWKKTIEARSVGDTGILELYIYHPNTYQAQQISLAVNQVLMSQSSNYQKGGDKVFISVIDQPLTSTYPVKPDIILNAIFALLLGVGAAVLYVYLFPVSNKGVVKKVDRKMESHETFIKDHIPRNLPSIEENDENKEEDYHYLDNKTETPRGNINNILR
jgi:capsular polysaccharide biosynthesis protein